MKSDNISSHSQRSVPQGATTRMLNMGTLGISIMGSAVSEAIKQSIVIFLLNIKI